MKLIQQTILIGLLSTVVFSCTKSYTCECYANYYSDPSLNFSSSYSIEAKNQSEATADCHEFETLDNQYFIQTCNAYID
jgi:hypothetical protein